MIPPLRLRPRGGIVVTPALMFLAIPMALGNHLSAPRGSDRMEADQ